MQRKIKYEFFLCLSFFRPSNIYKKLRTLFIFEHFVAITLLLRSIIFELDASKSIRDIAIFLHAVKMSLGVFLCCETGEFQTF